jgi:hypothetical protein
MTEGRVTLPRKAVAGQSLIFIPLSGPKANGLSGRDDKFVKQLAADLVSWEFLLVE